MKIPSTINTKTEGHYCINCFSTKIKRIFENNRTYYRCENCESTSERSLVIDNGVKWWLDADHNYWHESVGVVIFNSNHEILCVLRQISPFGYSIPAGHLEVGQAPLDEARREVLEETGLNLDKSRFELVAEFDLAGDSCRRGSDDHKWHLYRANIGDASGLKIKLNDEAAHFKWMTKQQLVRDGSTVFALRYIMEHFSPNLD